MRAAGREAMRRFRGPVRAHAKRSDSDPVSDADLAAQEAMARVIGEQRPDDGLLGEEALTVPGRRCWLLDPIDGTLAFLRGQPLWSTAACLRERDDTTVAAVYDAVADELFLARRGAPATLNGSEMHVRSPTPLRSALVRTWCDPHLAERTDFAAGLRALATTTAALQTGGSGSQALAWVACGRLDGWAEIHPAGSEKGWDWHPGELLVRSAGGATRELGEWRIAAASDRLADELAATVAR